jgi:Leucine-rich repeat (LRR) protein
MEKGQPGTETGPNKKVMVPEIQDIIDRSQNNLSSLEEIKNYLNKGLIEADLSINLLSSSIGLPASLKKLNFAMNRFTDVRSFMNLPNLEWLDLSLNQISSLEGMDLPNVKYLNLSSNNLTKLKGLDRCRGLSVLKIDRNKLKSIMVPSGIAQVSPFLSNSCKLFQLPRT